jgi:hypothetical protein
MAILYLFIQILARPLQNIINNKLAIDIFLYEPAILSSPIDLYKKVDVSRLVT